jgi:ribosomal protein S18 acetylase RimI-like enzyme
MKIRELRESDHRQVVSVVDGWWGGRRMADKLPRLFFRYFGETSFVVEEDGAMIAFLVGFVGDAEEAYIHFVGVHPEHRNRGIGRRLYATFFEEARRRGCQRVRCITSPVNEDSIAFHKRLGFWIVEGDREVGGVSVHPDYDGDGKDKVVFEKLC